MLPKLFLITLPPTHTFKGRLVFQCSNFHRRSFSLKAFVPQDAVVAEVTGNGDVAKVENGEVKPEVCIFLLMEFLL